MSFTNVLRRTAHRWAWDFVARDLDGSLTGTANAVVVSNTSITYGDSRCTVNDAYVGGIVCMDTLGWIRFAFNKAKPDAFLVKITNQANDTDTTPLLHKRLTRKDGYMVDLEANQTYKLEFSDAYRPTNASYSATMSGFGPYDYIIIELDLLVEPDRVFALDGVQSSTPLTASNNNGDWYWDNVTDTLSYILNNNNPDSPYEDYNYNFQVYKCRYANCTPPQPNLVIDQAKPPTQRPTSAVKFWSRNDTWATVLIDGEIKNRTPVFNESVVIPQNTWVVLDVVVPELLTLEIQGVLEFDDTLDNSLAAKVIFINGGYLIAGWEDVPFNHSLTISLTGVKGEPEFYLPDETSIGLKAIGLVTFFFEFLFVPRL